VSEWAGLNGPAKRVDTPGGPFPEAGSTPAASTILFIFGYLPPGAPTSICGQEYWRIAS
jgi:hypothetical protein